MASRTPIVFASVAALAACGNGPGPSAPQDRLGVRLVRCAAATPPPQLTGNDEVLRARHADRGTWGVSKRNRVVVVGSRANVTLGSISVKTGPIRTDRVLFAMRARLPDLRACYANEHSTARKATTSYRFSIRSDGVVAMVDATAPALSPTLDTCIRRAIRGTRFPPSSGTSTVQVPIVFDATGAYPTPVKEAAPPEPWTPFAVGTTPPSPAAFGAARATEAMVRGKLDELDKCFATPALTGSLRVLFEIDIAGELAGIRPGGLGDRKTEQCAARALSAMKVLTPLQEHVEVACDIARGDARPWRITPDAGYKLIEVDRTQLRHENETLLPGAGEPTALPADTYVVTARADTLGGMLQLAMLWAREANAILLAVSDGKPAPVFLGMGNASSEEPDDGALRPIVRVGSKTAMGCVGRASHKASVTSSTELGNLMQRLATRCRAVHCAATLAIGIDTDAVVRDLLEVASAARRHGFDRVLFGGAELSCQEPEEGKKPVDDDALDVSE